MDLWSLALGTLGGAAAVRGLAHVREHRVAPAGLADLVNWAFMVDDGVVLQKDGSLLAGWRYHGPDLSAATPEELDALSRHVNDALLPFTDDRSEEHTSELQSRLHLVCRLLLEKKKKQHI